MTPLNHILHVDDDDDIRAVTKVALEVIGNFRVCQFSSGREAMQHARSCSPQLCLLDVMMPEMTGEETWAGLSALPGMEDTPVIFMTAKAEKCFSDSLLGQGALAVITKPFDPTHLCSTILDAWNDHRIKS